MYIDLSRIEIRWKLNGDYLVLREKSAKPDVFAWINSSYQSSVYAKYKSQMDIWKPH